MQNCPIGKTTQISSMNFSLRHWNSFKDEETSGNLGLKYIISHSIMTAMWQNPEPENNWFFESMKNINEVILHRQEDR